jgi:hypothetical protein
MALSNPCNGFALEVPGHWNIQFFANGAPIFESDLYVGEFTPFVGFLSTVQFDTAIALDPTGLVLNIDNVYFGPVVPSPTALPLLILSGVFGFARSRERRLH